MRYRVNCVIISLLIILSLLIIIINIVELRELRRSVDTRLHHPTSSLTAVVPTVRHVITTQSRYAWIHPASSQHLQHIANVLQQLGYQLDKDQWLVFWSHDYPFTSHRALMMNLKSNQKVNHFAGSGYFTNKASLAGAKFPFMPLSYRLPQEAAVFSKEVSEDDDSLWVMKSNEHRGIKVHHFSQIDLQSKSSFVQQFIRHPLLISERKFDVGLYVAVTSVEPLRVYVYNEEVLLRFCSKDYEPFDADDVHRYVVGDDYTPTWKIPSLQQYYTEQMFSHKQTLSAYLKSQGHNSDQIWEDMNRIIIMVMLRFESSVYKATKEFADVSHFFELVRFDFVIDSTLRVWLMEVNMSPNLSSAHFAGNAVMYEQVIFNLFSLIGLAQFTSVTNHILDEQVSVNDRDVRVAAPQCITSSCNDCSSLDCKLCHRCQTKEIRSLLKTTYLEHVNRRGYKRLFPIPMDHVTQWSSDMPSPNYSDINKLMLLWFQEKCKQDNYWCS